MSRRSIHPLAAAPLRALLQQKAVGGETFTQCGLRDELCAHPVLSDFGLQTLRYYVRGQVARYEQLGWVERVGKVGARRVLYQATPAFPADTDQDDSDTTGERDGHAHSELDLRLEQDCEALREQMEASDQRLQAFQEIAAKYPNARGDVAPLFEQEKAQARALSEKLRAYAEVRQRLAQAGGEK